jgi:hypothetical protein
MRGLRIGVIGAGRALAAALLTMSIAACSVGAGSPSATATPEGNSFVATLATFQVIANRPARLLIALQTADQRWVSFGSVQLQFSFAGDGTDATPKPGVTMPSTTAHFLPIPESPTGTGRKTAVTYPSDGHGVYAAQDVSFPEVGFWQFLATGTLGDGTPVAATSYIQVLPKGTVPWVGDPAPASDSAVIGDPGVPNSAIDSRASGDNPIPDPELHQVSIADAIAAGDPALIVFSTPVYCVSQFCGPVTDMVEGLAADYSDRADFIHVEIYRDFQNDELNPAVNDWLVGPDGQLREPWTFLIGADGKVIGSWDTVATRAEIEPLLQALPKK